MQPQDVTAYGCDYSAGEFTPEQLNTYPGVRIDWLARYIGYSGNPKCISHYPGAYRAHRNSGRPVVLYHQIGYRDFEGGASSGRAHAQTALADARSQAVGWDGETPIIAAFDRRMPAFTRGGVTYRAIPLDEVRDYMRGYTSVLGYNTSGFYGFEDTMAHAVAEAWARFTMQCGARSAHIKGISAWQENNAQPVHLGVQTDRLELYVPLNSLGGKTSPSGTSLDLLEETQMERITLDPTTGDAAATVTLPVPTGRRYRLHIVPTGQQVVLHAIYNWGARPSNGKGGNPVTDGPITLSPQEVGVYDLPSGTGKTDIAYSSQTPVMVLLDPIL